MSKRRRRNKAGYETGIKGVYFTVIQELDTLRTKSIPEDNAWALLHRCTLLELEEAKVYEMTKALGEEWAVPEGTVILTAEQNYPSADLGDMIEHAKRCKKDFRYFASTYFKVNVPEDYLHIFKGFAP